MNQFLLYDIKLELSSYQIIKINLCDVISFLLLRIKYEAKNTYIRTSLLEYLKFYGAFLKS